MSKVLLQRENFDSFLIMQDQKKVYGAVEFPVCLRGDGWPTRRLSGFTISLYEYEVVIPAIWDAVKGVKEVTNQPRNCRPLF